MPSSAFSWAVAAHHSASNVYAAAKCKLNQDVVRTSSANGKADKPLRSERSFQEDPDTRISRDFLRLQVSVPVPATAAVAKACRRLVACTKLHKYIARTACFRRICTYRRSLASQAASP